MIRETPCHHRKFQQRQNVRQENSNGYNSSIQQDTVNTISLKWPWTSAGFLKICTSLIIKKNRLFEKADNIQRGNVISKIYFNVLSWRTDWRSPWRKGIFVCAILGKWTFNVFLSSKLQITVLCSVFFFSLLQDAEYRDRVCFPLLSPSLSDLEEVCTILWSALQSCNYCRDPLFHIKKKVFSVLWSLHTENWYFWISTSSNPTILKHSKG